MERIMTDPTENHQSPKCCFPTSHTGFLSSPPSLSVLLTWDDDGFLWLVAAIEMIPQPQSNTRQGWGDRSPPFGGQDIGLRLKLKCWLVCQNRRMTLSAKRLWIRAGKLPQSGILINVMRPPGTSSTSGSISRLEKWENQILLSKILRSIFAGAEKTASSLAFQSSS